MIWDIIGWASSTSCIWLIGYFSMKGWFAYISERSYSFWPRYAYEVLGMCAIVSTLMVPWIVLVGDDMFPGLIKPSTECITEGVEI